MLIDDIRAAIWLVLEVVYSLGLYHRNNVVGTLNLVNKIQKNGVNNFIFFHPP